MEYRLSGNARIPCEPNRLRRDNPKLYFTVRYDLPGDDSATAAAEVAMRVRKDALKPEEIISAGLWHGGRLVKYFPAR